jgi:hypothetical protein
MASIKNNSEANITGMLCCDGRYFLQCLEGSRLAVNRTYSKILSDPRHGNVVLLSYGEVASRHFSEWAMGYAALSSNAAADIKPDVLLRLVGDANSDQTLKPHAVSLPIARAQFLKYSIKRDFDPYALSDSASLALLEDLAAAFQA